MPRRSIALCRAPWISVLSLVFCGLRASILARNRCSLLCRLSLVVLLGLLVQPVMAQRATVPLFGNRLTPEDTEAVRTAGLVPLLVPVETSRVRKQNVVISILPEKGSLCSLGTTVRIEYYIAVVPVPRVVGKRRAAAEAAIARAGLACTLAYGSDREGRVTSQDPAAGTRLATVRSITREPHGTVVLTLTETPEPPPPWWPRVVIYILIGGAAAVLLYLVVRRLVPRLRQNTSVHSEDGEPPTCDVTLDTAGGGDSAIIPASDGGFRQPDVHDEAVTPAADTQGDPPSVTNSPPGPAAGAGTAQVSPEPENWVAQEVRVMLDAMNAALGRPELQTAFEKAYAPRHVAVIRNASGDVVDPQAPGIESSERSFLWAVQFGRTWRLVPAPGIDKYNLHDLRACFDVEKLPAAAQLLAEVVTPAEMDWRGRNWVLRQNGRVRLAGGGDV
jgi:hypothetical protein